MTQPAPFEVPAAERREPTAAQRFARRSAGVVAEDPDPGGDELEVPDRQVSLRAVMDIASAILITAGFATGTAAAWLAGGRVPGLATLAGALIALGFLLTL